MAHRIVTEKNVSADELVSARRGDGQATYLVLGKHSTAEDADRFLGILWKIAQATGQLSIGIEYASDDKFFLNIRNKSTAQIESAVKALNSKFTSFNLPFYMGLKELNSRGIEIRPIDASWGEQAKAEEAVGPASLMVSIVNYPVEGCIQIAEILSSLSRADAVRNPAIMHNIHELVSSGKTVAITIGSSHMQYLEQNIGDENVITIISPYQELRSNMENDARDALHGFNGRFNLPLYKWYIVSAAQSFGMPEDRLALYLKPIHDASSAKELRQLFQEIKAQLRSQ